MVFICPSIFISHLSTLRGCVMAKYHIRTYGCTLNQSDSDIMRGMLAQDGHTEAPSEAAADVLIINSCQVKSSTETKILNKLMQLQATKKPIILAGCLAINEKAVRKKAPKATIVGASSIKYINDAMEDALTFGAGTFRTFSSKENLPREATDGPIARIPISEGCLSACTFCVTKLARPKLASYTLKGVVREVEIALAHGAKEIQLTSMDSGAYGKDIGVDLADLLQELVLLPGDFRIRLGMINPQHIRHLGLARFLSCFKSKKMYKFLHIPVQAGSERVLKSMRRNHSVADFEELAGAFRQAYPAGMLATDIIVGFPGETEDDFAQTLFLLNKWQFDMANLSKFTPRPGTIAKKMEQLPNGVIKQRSIAATRVIRKWMKMRNMECIGETYDVLVTEKQSTLTGRNDDYRMISLPPSCTMALGSRTSATVTGALYSCCLGKQL